MLDDIARIADAGVARLGGATSLDELRAFESELLGKKSELTSLKAKLGGLDADERRTVGQAFNDARARLEAVAAARRNDLAAGERASKLEAERLDLTEVSRSRHLGHLHLVSQAIEHLEDVFVGLGFTIAEGPEVETDWHNFGALNFPPGHPARDMYDTLYVDLGEPESTLVMLRVVNLANQRFAEKCREAYATHRNVDEMIATDIELGRVEAEWRATQPATGAR